MFKNLRNKFLILNLSIISIMMGISFTSIYLITYNNVRRDILRELYRVSEFNPKPFESPNPRLNQPPPDINNDERSKRSIFVSLLTDKNWNILSSTSIFEIESELYEALKTSALDKNDDTGIVKVDEKYWEFIIKPYFDTYKIVFLDITPQQDILQSLIQTFLIVALVMLFFIFFTSKFFANNSIKPIKEAFEKQKQFITDASHELKTPLAIINTNIDVLLANGEDQINNQSKWLHYIKSETERMTKLTKNLLYLAQIDYSDIKMVFVDFDLSEIIENIILTMEAVFFEKDISFFYDIENNLITHGNNEQIKQVILILLDNAVKYTNTKGTVKISLEKYHTNIIFSITNTGQGISEEHIKNVFDRFYRVDTSRERKVGGYGLGLSIAKTIIDQHKGKISVKSILNESTTFQIELPLIHNS